MTINLSLGNMKMNGYEMEDLSLKESNPTPLAVWALILFWPIAAWAHVETGQAGGFVSGLLHPVSGLDHVLAMVAVGLWGAQLGQPAMWLLPVAW